MQTETGKDKERKGREIDRDTETQQETTREGREADRRR